MKRVATILVITLLITSAIANERENYDSIENDNSNVLYVGGAGEGNYTHIQAAINAANDGDTIFVYDDSSPYHENIVIDKSITLIGENKNTVIMGKGEKDVVYICASNVTIKNFTITGSYMPNTGIYIFNSTGNKIFDCILENNGIAIFVEKSSKNLISRCDISHGSDGIHIKSSSENRIYDCKIHNNFDGIFIESFDGHSCSNSIEKCNVYSNDDNGMELFEACDTSISNTNISNNRYGLGIYSSINVSVSNCRFMNDGIRLQGDRLQHFIHKMENVTINRKPLLYFINQQGVEIQNDAGEILLINCSNFLIKNLSIENADVGIEIVYGVGNKIKNCKIYGNDDCGILVINSSYNEIGKCKIKSKYGYGLHAINSFKNSIHDNEFIKNSQCIQLLYSNNNSITNNTIDGKYIPQIGMRIDMSKRNFIAYNNITGCWDTGMVIASRLSIDKNIIYRNNFYRNGVHAIWIADSFANMVVENNFIQHPVTASFENAWNVWFHNYWDGWRAPIPKPIYGYIEGFNGTPLFPLINFDWHPALKPCGGRK